MNSRVEDILESVVNNEEYQSPPVSRIEELLLQVKQSVEQGGMSDEQIAALEAQIENDIKEHGVAGDSAYEIAVKNGFSGTEAEWLLSLHGKDGDDADTTAVEEMIGNLADLDTISKTNLVSAINEIVNSGGSGGGGSSSDIGLSVIDGAINVTYDDGE